MAVYDIFFYYILSGKFAQIIFLQIIFLYIPIFQTIWINHNNISLTWIAVSFESFPYYPWFPVRENSEVVTIYPESSTWMDLLWPFGVIPIYSLSSSYSNYVVSHSSYYIPISLNIPMLYSRLVISSLSASFSYNSYFRYHKVLYPYSFNLTKL